MKKYTPQQILDLIPESGLPLIVIATIKPDAVALLQPFAVDGQLPKDVIVERFGPFITDLVAEYNTCVDAIEMIVDPVLEFVGDKAATVRGALSRDESIRARALESAAQVVNYANAQTALEVAVIFENYIRGHDPQVRVVNGTNTFPLE